MNWQKKADNINRRVRRKYPKAGKVTAAQVKSLFFVAKDQCENCRSKDRLTIDHIVPLRVGGLNIWRNLQILCFACNQRKGSEYLPGMGQEIKKQQKIKGAGK